MSGLPGLNKCVYCLEPVKEDETFPHLEFIQSAHRECVIRMIFGSEAHQKGTCSCSGGTDTDENEGETLRQGAQRAYAEFLIQRHGKPEPV